MLPKDIQIDSELMMKYLALMIALKSYYQTCHWKSKGTEYYSDHLLFERLYNDMIEEVDGFAEKAVTLSSDKSVCPRGLYEYVSKLMEVFDKDVKEEDSFDKTVENAYNFNYSFLKKSEELYSKLEKDNNLTLGLDDFITSTYSKHEEHDYLLRRRLKGTEQGSENEQ
jgi:DNA-binding ferritin-like protein